MREDDATKEIKYDIEHKFNKALVAKWVPRANIRRQALTAEEIELQRLEKIWRNQIRRMRNAQERKNKSKRDAKIEEELAKR